MVSATIRDYQPADAEAVISIFRELQAYELQFNRHLRSPQDIGLWYIERILKQSETLNGHLLVAEHLGLVVGLAHVYARIEEKGEEEELPHSYALVSELAVLEAWRGKGIGRLLLTECERRAKLAGRDEMLLAVYPENRSALGLYESAGYRPAKLRMSKRLS